MKIIIILSIIALSRASIFYDLNQDDFEGVKNSRNFTGKVALVTGSSSGIGTGIVKLLSLLGAQVVVTGRNVTEISEVAEEVRELSPTKLKPLEITADLSDDKAIESLINETIKTFGKLDILVNNAGFGTGVNIDSSNFIQQFDQVHRVDLRAPALLNHLSVPYLKKTNGTIIHISSIAAMSPMSSGLPYNMAKVGMDMMTRCLAIELGPQGIRVNTINPGATVSNFNINVSGNNLTPEEIDQIWKVVLQKTPLRRVGYPLDIAKGVAFLASTDASFITGANLVIDGGLVYTMGDLF